MRHVLCHYLSAALVVFAAHQLTPAARAAAPKTPACWRVEDLRRGMKGHGRTVLKGTRVETFQVEVLGVLRHSSPGRDLVLAQHADEIGAALHIGDRFDLARTLSDAARTISFYVEAGIRTAANASCNRARAVASSNGGVAGGS